MIVAVCGKGGVGKTTVSAMGARALLASGRKALVVDADPAGGLAMALGVKPARTLNDVRKDLISEVKAGTRDERDLAVSVDYLVAEALTEKGNVAFLAIGRPEDEGCYCKVNVILKDAIEALGGMFDAAIVDAEAGIEQVNRKVMGSVDYLLLVSDVSAKAVRTAETVKEVADRMIGGVGSGLIVNRARDEQEARAAAGRSSLEYLGWVPEDDIVREFDASERSFFELPECPSRAAVEEAFRQTGLLD